MKELTNQFTWNFRGWARRILDGFIAHNWAYFYVLVLNYKVLLLFIRPSHFSIF
jgi:hypothetical protein